MADGSVYRGLKRRRKEQWLEMEKLYRCVSCTKEFKVISDPTFPLYKAHEVEMNVECPFCSRINAIVWPAG